MTGLLARADRARSGAATTALDLWRIADEESAGSGSRRRELYRHAMIHAGMLVDRATEKPFKVCPMCDARLR